MRLLLGRFLFGRMFGFLYLVAGLVLSILSEYAFGIRWGERSDWLFEIGCLLVIDVSYMLNFCFSLGSRVISESRLILLTMSSLTIISAESVVNPLKESFFLCVMTLCVYFVFGIRYFCLDKLITERSRK